MRALPLFHRVVGKPVVVLGEGEAADAKRRLVERAGGRPVAEVEKGAGLAFVAHADPALCEAEASRLREAGLLVNVVDRPDLCDFTTPSIVDRDPVLIAVGTDGTSAGLAKHLRLRIETLLPASLGRLAEALHAARGALRARWPGGADRRRVLDAALEEGGALDPLVETSADRVDAWLGASERDTKDEAVSIVLSSTDPEDLTLRQARLLGRADCILFEPAVPAEVLDRARADAVRLELPYDGQPPEGLVLMVTLAR